MEYKSRASLIKRLTCIFFLGFSSGLPLALILGSLQAWYTIENVDIYTIGFLSLISYPYSLKFLWAPLLDRFVLPFLGRRRGWMLITQILISFFIIIMSCLSPTINPILLAFVGIILAFCSASFDVAFDAYKVEILSTRKRGLGAALGVEGYRLAMLTSGALSLIIADRIGWNLTYLIMACLMLLTSIVTFLAPSTSKKYHVIKESIYATFKTSYKDLVTRQKLSIFIGILVLIVIYRIGDAFAHCLTTPFLLRGIGFSQTEVGVINKIVGLSASLIGIFFGGLLIVRLGIYRALFLFGILQAISNLLYMQLAYVGKNYFFAAIAIFCENLCSGMGTAAFVAFLMSLCNKKYTATQFALLSSLGVTGRIIVGPISGVLVKNFGWGQFYFLTFIFALPCLFLLYVLRDFIKEREKEGESEESAKDLATDVA